MTDKATVYVGNLLPHVNEARLRRRFQYFGRVIGIHWPKDHTSGIPRRFAFIDMVHPFDAELAVEFLDRKYLQGCRLRVSKAKSKTANVESIEPISANVEVAEWHSNLFADAQRISARIQEDRTETAQYNIWNEVVEQYPEFAEGFQTIQESLIMDFLEVDKEFLAKIFSPVCDDMPSGAWVAWDDRKTDCSERRGAYACLTDRRVALVLHAFYRNRQHDKQCWRARLFRFSDGLVLPMPPKENHFGKLDPVSWRLCPPSLHEYFIPDLKKMLSEAED